MGAPPLVSAVERQRVAAEGDQPQDDRVDDPAFDAALAELGHRPPLQEEDTEGGGGQRDRPQRRPELAERPRDDPGRDDDGDAAGQERGEGEQGVRGRVGQREGPDPEGADAQEAVGTSTALRRRAR